MEWSKRHCVRKPSAKYALLAVMLSNRRWGAPIDEENLLSIAAIETNEYPTATDVFDGLRSEVYITNEGDRGITLNTSAFGKLADILYHACGWEPFESTLRRKHYEG